MCVRIYRTALGRMLRPWLLGSEWAGFSKTAYLIGPYYYFSLAVLILATLGLLLFKL